MSDKSYSDNKIEALEDIINEYDAMMLALGLMQQMPKHAVLEYSRIRSKPGHAIAITNASARARARRQADFDEYVAQ